MGASRLTTRLLVGSGVVAGALLLAAGAAGAEKPEKADQAKGPKAQAAVVAEAAEPTTSTSTTSTSTTSTSTTSTSTTSTSTTSTTSTTAPPPTTTSTTSTTTAPTTTTSTTPSTTSTTTEPVVQPAVLPIRGPIIVAGPESPGTDLTPTWAFIEPDGEPTTCSLLLGSTVVFGPAPCSGTVTYNLTGQPYATYTFVVSDGTQSMSGTYTLMPAPPTITSAPTSPGIDSSPTWSFTLPGGTTGSCSLLSGTTVVAGPVACSGSQTFAITADGVYTFRVVAVAPNGSTSAPATSTYTVDITGPAAPVITSGPAVVSDDETPTWTFTTDGATASTECSLSRDGVVLFGPAPCSGSATYDLTLEPDGEYTFTVIAYDSAGNDSAPATSSYTLQRLPLATTPTITSEPTSPGTDTTPTWSFTTPSGTTTECTVYQGSTVISGPVSCSGSFTPTLTADGTYTFEVVAFDTVNGARSLPATSTYTLDTTAPTTPAFTSTPGAGGNQRFLEWTFTVPADAVKVECTLFHGTTAVIGPRDCTDGVFKANMSNRPDGLYTLSVVAIDALGNRSAPATSAYTLDRTPPAAPTITSGPSGLTNDATATWTFTAEAGATTTCTLSGPVTITGPCSGSASYDLTNLPDGTYTFSVKATDKAGNTSTAATRTITLDRTPPEAPTITGGTSGTSSDLTPEWTFKAPGNVTTMCSVLSGSTVVIGPVPCSSPAKFDLSGLPDGRYTFSVVAVDDAGNASAPATRSYTLSTGRQPTPQALPPAPPPAPAPAPAPGPPPPPPSGFTPVDVAPISPSVPGPITVPRPTPPRPGPGPGVPGPGGIVPDVSDRRPPPSGIIEQAGRVVEEAAEGAAFPLLLLILVVLFLIIQNRIDRRDPKLAQAPVHAGEELEFRPPSSRRGTQ